MGVVVGGAWSWAVGFLLLLLLLAVNGKQKMAWEKFGKEGNFSVSSSLEKSFLSHPCLTTEGGGFPNTAQEGLVGTGQGTQKVPSDFTRMEQPWATRFVLEVEPNLPPTGGQDPSHLLPKTSRAWDAPGEATLGIFGILCVRCDVMEKEMQWGISAEHWLLEGCTWIVCLAGT